MKKKIIIFMPSIEGGGVEKNLYLVSNYLAKKKLRLSLITISNKYKYKFHKSIKFISLPGNIWDKMTRRIKYFFSLILLIKEILSDRNVVVFSFQANLYAVIICKLFGIKIISRSNSSPSGWSKNFIKNLIYKIGLNLADKLIVNSIEFQKEMKRKFSITASHIYNPLNKKEIIKLSKKKIKSHFPKKSLKIINVGRLVDQKDQITLLKAINKIKKLFRIKLILIGRGEKYSFLQNYIKEKKLSKMIKIFYTPNPFPYIKQSDLFILTSRYEGLPNVLLESIVLKKMIISSDCPTGPKEILLNGKAGLLFKSGNYNELSEKIIFYVKNKRKCKKMVNISSRKIDRFDYKKNLKKYLNLVMNT